MAYVVGISSGIFGAAAQQERMQYLGVSQKVNYCITQGVNFTQIDLETMSEFKDPQIGIEDEDKRSTWKRKIEGMNIALGFHGESQAMGGRETPIKLDSAIEDDYLRSHERLWEVLDKAGLIGAKYYLLHSSESTPFILLGKDFQPSVLVDFWGRPLEAFINEQKKVVDGEERNWMMDWVMEQEFIWREWWGKIPENIAKETIETEEQELSITHPERVAELGKKRGDLINFYKNLYKKRFLEQIKSRSLHYGPERFAYWIVAKWMEVNKDREPLWTKITAEWDRIKMDINRPDSVASMDDEVFRESTEGISLWVPVVAAKYLWGHFNQDKCESRERPAPFRDKDPKELLEKYGMYFVIETPMASAGMENLMRLSDPVHMCHLVEEMNFKFFRVALDFEHILSNYIDPKEMIERMPANGGSLVKVVHLGWPTPVIPAHMPIYVGSEQHVWIYNRLWELRQKGFTPDDDRYLIYERGSEHIQQSILAMKLVVEFLNSDTAPDDLPDKFFGIKTGEFASLERQRVVISEHGEDPLTDLLAVPEEDYTMLGRVASSAPSAGPEKWKKRMLR